MCGRYAIFTEEENEEMREIINEVNERFKEDSLKLKTGEIFPTNTVPVITAVESEKTAINLFKWGFPNFKATSGVIINARCETLEEKPTFRKILHTKRCIIPASGFYEWKQTETKKEKYIISVSNQSLFYMAGLFNTFTDKNGRMFNGFVIITTEANEEMLKIHNRMPVIFSKKDSDLWLSSGLVDFKEILKPYIKEHLEIIKVS